MTIHTEHPFLDPDPDPVRRLRGRLGGRVTLWTTGAADRRAGLTVSSMLVAPGEPPEVIGLVDPDSDFAALVEESGRFVVQLLEWRHREIADAFAGLTPAPGGAFRLASWSATEFGPVLADVAGWAGVSLAPPRSGETSAGWSRLVRGAVEEVRLDEEREPLVHRRGRYERP